MELTRLIPSCGVWKSDCALAPCVSTGLRKFREQEGWISDTANATNPTKKIFLLSFISSDLCCYGLKVHIEPDHIVPGRRVGPHIYAGPCDIPVTGIGSVVHICALRQADLRIETGVFCQG